MNRRHAAVVSAFLALAVVLGMASTLRTARVGANAAPTASAAQIALRNRRLDRAEAALRKAAAQRPPALPALPARPAARAAAPAPAAPARVVYVRPAPVVHVVHRQGEHEGGDGGEHGGGDGGGLDD